MGVIRAQGADAAGFLHGQLTSDIEGLSGHEARLAGYCSAKGRLLASFIVLRPATDELLLICDASVLPATLKRLSMFVLRAKCRLSDASAELAVRGWVNADLAPLGLALAQAWAVATRGALHALRLPDAAGATRALLVGPAAELAALPLDTLPALPEATWQWLQVQSAVPVITAANVEQFVPQMVNLEAVGGVNFKKGCYPGQEVVARSQYRGTLKRRMFPVHAEVPLAAGDELFHSADPAQPAGRVVIGAPAPGGGHDALAELKLSALQDGTLHAGSSSGPLLRVGTLPYALPSEV